MLAHPLIHTGIHTYIIYIHTSCPVLSCLYTALTVMCPSIRGSEKKKKLTIAGTPAPVNSQSSPAPKPPPTYSTLDCCSTGLALSAAHFNMPLQVHTYIHTYRELPSTSPLSANKDMHHKKYLNQVEIIRTLNISSRLGN